MKKALSVFLLLFSVLLSAQKITVFNAEDQSPLVGATLIISSTAGDISYLSANRNGEAIVSVNQFDGGQFVFVKTSFIGFETKIDTLFRGRNKTILLTPKSYSVEDIVVTAQYSPTSVENSVHKVKVISRQKIENMAAVNLQDVLTNELNVRLSQDNILGSGMSLQGISGQNVKILIDGVPVIGRLDGQIDLNQINLNNVERIEIVEGPLSVNYGSNALAGTINIITKKEQKEKITLGVNVYTESIGTYNVETNVGLSPLKNHSINLSVGRNYFDGWNAEDDFLPSFEAQRADSGRVKQWNPKEQYFGRLQYNFKFRELLLSYKGELFDEKITNFGLPRRTRTSFAAFDDYYHTQRIDNALFAQGKLNEKWSINWTAAYNDFERIKEAKRKDLVTLQSTRVQEDANNDTQDTSTFNLLMSRASIATTKDSSWFNYEIGYDINIEKAAGKRIEGGEQELGDYAAFVSTEIKITKNAILKPAVRYSYNTQYKAPITPSVNLKYSRKNSTFRFSYAKGFRAPSLKELYFNFDDINHSLFGNADLKAERSNNFSGSVRQKFLAKEVLLKGEILGFYNEIYNQISFAQSNIGNGDTLVYFNIGETQTKGLNLNFSVIYENFQLNLGSSYIGRYNRLADENPIDEFSYSAEFVGNLNYQFKKPQLTVALFAKHQGELPGFGYNNEGKVVKQTIESYQILDATISKNFWKKRINAAIGCKNIMDVQNVQANLSGGVHNGGRSSISVGTGRTVFIKLGLQLSKK
jgi:outer membrane receptor for ferrienterochelin and colicins